MVRGRLSYLIYDRSGLSIDHNTQNNWTVDAYWTMEGGRAGIRWQRGPNYNGFFPVSGATVNAGNAIVINTQPPSSITITAWSLPKTGAIHTP